MTSSVEASPRQAVWKPDLLTVVAIAIVAYALANVAHEAVGHGGACLLVGGKPLALLSIGFDCDESTLTDGGRRIVAAGGTLMNLLLGSLALLGLLARRRSAHGRWFLWLLATINLFQAAGYFLFSGIANVGDWAVVVGGLRPTLAWRTALVVVGGIAYVGVAWAAAGWLAPLVGAQGRIARARRLAVPSYLTGGLLYCVSSLFNPVGLEFVLISAGASSFAATSGFLWFQQWLRGDRIPPSSEAIVLDRRRSWLVSGVVTALVFIGLLGPGIRF